MHQIWFPLGALPQIPKVKFRGPTSSGKKGKDWEKDFKGEKEKRKCKEKG